MFNYYNEDVIPFLLKKFNVTKLVICGSSNSGVISNVLNFSRDASISYVVIDPINDFKNNFIKDFPIFALSNLDDYDAIFLNDDANWYVVYNELNIIKKHNKKFPLVFICNNTFPNKRRDSYIDPNIIPDEFRKNFSKYFMHDGIVLRDNCYHAIEENSSKNGVLTAIEDFLNENSFVNLMDVALLEGCEILYSTDSISQNMINNIYDEISDYKLEINNVSDYICYNNFLIDYISQFNISDNDFENIASLKNQIEIDERCNSDYKKQINMMEEELNYRNSKISMFESKLNLKDSYIDKFKAILLNKNLDIEHEHDVNKHLNREIISLKADKFLNEEKEESTHLKVFEMQNNLVEKDNQIEIYRKKYDELNSRLNLVKYEYHRQFFKLDRDNYCTNSFKEIIQNNFLEIQYIKTNYLIKKLLLPINYLYLIFKSNRKEVFLNLKIYQALKNSDYFDIGYYLSNNGDIQRSKWYKYFSLELHYVCKGFHEKRKFNKNNWNFTSKKELFDYILKMK